jgi:hypothetical protein
MTSHDLGPYAARKARRFVGRLDDDQRGVIRGGALKPGEQPDPQLLEALADWESAVDRVARATSSARRSADPKETLPMPTQQLVDVDKLIARLSERTNGNAAARLPGLKRSAEHIVLDVDATNAAVPHGTYASGTSPNPSFLAALDARVAARTALVLGRLNLIITGTISGMPTLPKFESLPEAGAQGGQKKEAPSHSFTVSPDVTAPVIDASCYLNVSAQLDLLTAPIVDRLLKLAVIAEAEAQVVAVIEAATVTPPADLGAALATFTGPLWTPTVVIVPPGDLIGLGANVLPMQAAGIAIVVVPTATTITVLDPFGVSGALTDENLSAVEPSVIGRQVASMIWGTVSISPGAAVSVA